MEKSYKRNFRVVELYSGIGGMHCALKKSSIGNNSEIVFAADLNPLCNEIYKFNFPDTNLKCLNINALTAETLNRFSPDLILMSPPCQPFTRQGKQKDKDDARNRSLLQFISQIPHLSNISYILLENVKGFEKSETRKQLIQTLNSCNFNYKEFLLNPFQFGICNSRLRYYLLAKRNLTNSIFTENIIEELPNNHESVILKMNYFHNIPKKISDILEHKPSSGNWDKEYQKIPLDTVKKYFAVMDIVGYDSCHSCCFTQGYSRYYEGTGSVISVFNDEEISDHKKKIKNAYKRNPMEYEVLLQSLNLRLIAPNEILALMCFPENFFFPSHITTRQRYKAISNSINVYVVSFLISYLFDNNNF